MPDGTWEDGYESTGLAAWTVVVAIGDLILTAYISSIDPGAQIRVSAWSANLDYLGKTCTLTLSNTAVAGSASYQDDMEPNAVDGVEAVFLVTGYVVGQTEMYAEVDSGS